MIKVLQIIGLLLFLGGVSFAQNKIGFVDGYLFYDEKIGIKRLVEVVKLTYVCHFNGIDLEEKIVRVKNEIQELKILGKIAEQKKLELSELEEKIKKRNDEWRLADKKRFSILVEPIEKQVKEKLNSFKVKNGYIEIFDLSDDKILDAILYLDKSLDITTEFIKFCNEEFEKEKSQK